MQLLSVIRILVLLEKNKLFHKYNAPIHTSVILMAKINELKFELLLNAFYSPDLACLDYLLFTTKNGSVVKDLPTMKRWSLLLLVILKESTVPNINRISKLFNIAGKSVAS